MQKKTFITYFAEQKKRNLYCLMKNFADKEVNRREMKHNVFKNVAKFDFVIIICVGESHRIFFL